MEGNHLLISWHHEMCLEKSPFKIINKSILHNIEWHFIVFISNDHLISISVLDTVKHESSYCLKLFIIYRLNQITPLPMYY